MQADARQAGFVGIKGEREDEPSSLSLSLLGSVTGRSCEKQSGVFHCEQISCFLYHIHTSPASRFHGH